MFHQEKWHIFCILRKNGFKNCEIRKDSDKFVLKTLFMPYSKEVMRYCSFKLSTKFEEQQSFNFQSNPNYLGMKSMLSRKSYHQNP